MDSNGIVTVTVDTLWRHGAGVGCDVDPVNCDADFPGGAGVDPGRFAPLPPALDQSSFFCPYTSATVTLSPGTSMRIVRVQSDGTPDLVGAPVYRWSGSEFTMGPILPATTPPGTTVGTPDDSNPLFDIRTQQFIIPFGSTDDPGKSTSSVLNLPVNSTAVNPYANDYDIIWNDWSRVRGIGNLPTNDDCTSSSSGYGFHIRVRWSGAGHPNQGPSINSVPNPNIAKNEAYSDNVYATDADGDTITYTLVDPPTTYPNFGPQTQAGASAGLAHELQLSAAGLLTMDSTGSNTLVDNYFSAASQADYLVRYRVQDSKGFTSERDMLLNVITGNHPPVLTGVANITVSADNLATIGPITATDPDGGQTVTLTSSGIPPGASFSNVSGSSFTWTPSLSQVGTWVVSFSATDNGTDPLTTTKLAIITVNSGQHKPLFKVINNVTVGVSDVNLNVFTEEVHTVDLYASDEDAGQQQTLVYTLPILETSTNGTSWSTVTADGSGQYTLDSNYSITHTALNAPVPILNDGGASHLVDRLSIYMKYAEQGVYFRLHPRVTDTDSLHDDAVLYISVGPNADHSPVFAISATIDGVAVNPPSDLYVTSGQSVNVSATGTDPDVETTGSPPVVTPTPLTMSVTGNPGFLPFALDTTAPPPGTNPVTGHVSGTIAGSPGTTYDVKFTVSDGLISQDAWTHIHVLAGGTVSTDIFAVAPNTGVPAGGGSFTVWGQGFAAGTTVKIGNQLATGARVSDIQWTGTVPTCVDGDGVACATATGAARDVTVISTNGTATLPGGYVYLGPKANGSDCSAGPDCATGFCVNGTCCSSGCTTPPGSIAAGCSLTTCVGGSTCKYVDIRTCRTPPSTGEGGAACPGGAGCWQSSSDPSHYGCFAGETVPVGSCNNPDSDGDGLPDRWETDGFVDGNCDGDFADVAPGGLDVALPGAQVGTKDVYVTYDWMEKDITSFPGEARHKPLDDYPVTFGTVPRGNQPAPLTKVAAAFATQGFNIHFEENTNPSQKTVDSTSPACSGAVTTNCCPSTDDCTARTLGNATGATSPLIHHRVLSMANPPLSPTKAIDQVPVSTCVGGDGVSFYQIKAQNFNYAKKFTHKYMVFGHNSHCFGGDVSCSAGDCTATCGLSACGNSGGAGDTLGICTAPQPNSTGLAELPGDDIIISLGGNTLADGTLADGVTLKTGAAVLQRTRDMDNLARAQAATVMHELGHTLGLDHGGPSGSVSCSDVSTTRNRKPNYVSVMQYALQSTGILRADNVGAAFGTPPHPAPPNPNYSQNAGGGFWRVDYSDSILSGITLSETGSINDTNPFSHACGCSGAGCPASGRPRDADISIAYKLTKNLITDPCTSQKVTIFTCGDIDWNADLANNTASTSEVFGADVNADYIDQGAGGTCPTENDLISGDDWTWVKGHVAFQCGSSFVDGASPTGGRSFYSATVEKHPAMDVLMGTTNGFPITVQAVVQPGEPDLIPPVGTFTVAILSQVEPDTGELTFDPTQIVIGKLTFAGANVRSYTFSDFNGDGKPDLIAEFSTGDTTLNASSTKAVVLGELTNGQAFNALATFTAVTPNAVQENVTLNVANTALVPSYCGGAASCASPFQGARIRLFHVITNPDPSGYVNLFNNMNPAAVEESGCVTNALGTCTLPAPTISGGQYFAVLRASYGGKTIYTGQNIGTGTNFTQVSTTRQFDLIENVTLTATTPPVVQISFGGGKKTVVTGSVLELVYPDFTVWDAGASIWTYPVIMTSDSEWSVDVCATVPNGYVVLGVYDSAGHFSANSSCTQAFVANESKVIVFKVEDQLSPPPNVELNITTKHHGLERHHVINLPGARRGRDIPMDFDVEADPWTGRKILQKSKNVFDFGNNANSNNALHTLNTY
jgi:hypothetical protein